MGTESWIGTGDHSESFEEFITAYQHWGRKIQSKEWMDDQSTEAIEEMVDARLDAIFGIANEKLRDPRPRREL